MRRGLVFCQDLTFEVKFIMPAKYTIHTEPTPHRFGPITKSGIIAWEEGCLKCAVCVKKRCVYKVYDNRTLDTRQMIDAIDNQCMNCLRCVQGCPKELIHKSINPEYKAMGDSHWTPEIITSLWNQAETGKIPVSGAGYPGAFSGRGFDSMWTDMSEIVRPTRDGIHGREYISTAIDLGSTPSYLGFNKEGHLTTEIASLVDIPLPIILKAPPFGAIGPATIEGWAVAAKRLGTLFAAPEKMIQDTPHGYGRWLIPQMDLKGDKPDKGLSEARIVEIPWSENWRPMIKDLQEQVPSSLISIRVPMARGMEQKVLSMVNEGVSLIHLEGGPDSCLVDDHETHVMDGIRSVHLDLVEQKIREEVTLLVSGGLSMAEHVAKSIICGADGVFADLPILIALECRMCRRCVKGLSCPVEIDRASSEWVVSRVVNLMGAWHNQLLEVMGAMGMRDARRLRGEVGRAMFFEDLENSTFGSMKEIGSGCELE